MILDYIFDEEKVSDGTEESKMKQNASITTSLKDDPELVVKRYIAESDSVINKYENSSNLKDKLDSIKRAIFLISLGLAIVNAVLTFFSFGITNKIFGLLRTALFGLIAKIFSKPETALLKKSSYYKKDLMVAYSKLASLHANKKIPAQYKQEIAENMAIIRAYLQEIEGDDHIKTNAQLVQKNSADTIDNIYDTFYKL